MAACPGVAAGAHAHTAVVAPLAEVARGDNLLLPPHLRIVLDLTRVREPPCRHLLPHLLLRRAVRRLRLLILRLPNMALPLDNALPLFLQSSIRILHLLSGEVDRAACATLRPCVTARHVAARRRKDVPAVARRRP